METTQDERKCHFRFVIFVHIHAHTCTMHTDTPNPTPEIHIYKYIGYMSMVQNRFKSNKHNVMECSSLTARVYGSTDTHNSFRSNKWKLFCDRLSVRPCSLFYFYYFSIVGDISFFIIDFRNGQRWLKLLDSKKKFGWSKNWFCNFFLVDSYRNYIFWMIGNSFFFFFINSYEHLPINRAHISHLWCTQQF